MPCELHPGIRSFKIRISHVNDPFGSIFSVLPPSTTLRRYLRRAYATTAGQIGQLYCDVLSMTTVHDPLKTEKIVKNLIAVRMKLNRTRALRRNVAYEVSGGVLLGSMF